MRVASLSFAQLVCGAGRVDGGDGDDAYHISGILELHSIAQCRCRDRSTDGRTGGRSRNRFAPSLLLPASFGFDKSPIGEIDEGLIGQTGSA